MLRQSFIHLPKIGPKTEFRLWRAGLSDWPAFCACPAESLRELSLAAARHEQLCRMLDESAERLACRDSRYFASNLPARELWRLFGEFHDQAAYLDIETNGFDRVTAVVVHREGQTLLFARDENLHELPAHLAGVKLLVTYNGRCFDWPVLLSNFAALPEPAAHLDLRYPFVRLQFRGGLKAIETAIGLRRPDELQGIDGWSAVLLWKWHRRGDSRALPALLRYCAEDVLNLKFLAEFAYNRLAAQLPTQAAPMLGEPSVAVCDHLPRVDPAIMDRCREACNTLAASAAPPPADPRIPSI